MYKLQLASNGAIDFNRVLVTDFGTLAIRQHVPWLVGSKSQEFGVLSDGHVYHD